MSATTYRASFTLPSDQAVMLSNVAKRLGCSQSAVLSILLGETLPYVAVGLAVDVTEGTVTRRLVGGSAQGVREDILQALHEGRGFAQLGLPLNQALA